MEIHGSEEVDIVEGKWESLWKNEYCSMESQLNEVVIIYREVGVGIA